MSKTYTITTDDGSFVLEVTPNEDGITSTINLEGQCHIDVLIDRFEELADKYEDLRLELEET